MKKWIAFVLIFAFALSLAACDLFMISDGNEPAFEKANSNVSSDKMIAFGGDGNIEEGDVSIVYKTDGNGNVSIVRPGSSDIFEKPQQEEPEINEPASVSVTVDALVGEWHSASRDEDYIKTRFYSFNSDGTFSSSNCEYMYSASAPELFPGLEDGWYAVPMGFPSSYGTYKIEGSSIVLSYTHEEFCDPYEEPIVYTITVYAVSDEKIVLGDVWDEDIRDTFVNGQSLQYDGDYITALCNRLDIDMDP